MPLSHDGQRGPFYPVFERLELSAAVGYTTPRLLGIEQDEIDIWHPSNWTYKEYVEEYPEEVFALWEPTALHWVHTAYHGEALSRVRNRYIAIYHRLQGEPLGRTRIRLVDEAFRLTYPERYA